VSGADRIAVARVRSVNPARREVRLELFVGFVWPEQAPQVARFSGGSARPLKLESARPAPGGAVLCMTAGVPREMIAALKGARYEVDERDAAAYTAEGWRASTWIGYAVRSEAGGLLGRVSKIWETAANAAFTVESETMGAMTLPAIEQVVLGVDEEAEVIVIADDIEPYVVRDAD
jgi:ribosomal 30S subunit maturation factor RimM